MHAGLRRQGYPVARCTVARLMPAVGLREVAGLIRPFRGRAVAATVSTQETS